MWTWEEVGSGRLQASRGEGALVHSAHDAELGGGPRHAVVGFLPLVGATMASALGPSRRPCPGVRGAR